MGDFWKKIIFSDTDFIYIYIFISGRFETCTPIVIFKSDDYWKLKISFIKKLFFSYKILFHSRSYQNQVSNHLQFCIFSPFSQIRITFSIRLFDEFLINSASNYKKKLKFYISVNLILIYSIIIQVFRSLCMRDFVMYYGHTDLQYKQSVSLFY